MYRDAFEELVDQDDNNVVAAENADRVVGCHQLTFIRGLSHTGGLRAQVESVGVVSDLRGTGLGTELMHDAIDRARSRNCTSIQLTTDTRRSDTKRFYERLGFVASHHGMKQFCSCALLRPQRGAADRGLEDTGRRQSARRSRGRSGASWTPRPDPG